MNFFNQKNNRWIGFIFALLIVILIIYTSNYLVQKLKVEEQIKIENYAKVQELLNSSDNLTPEMHALLLEIIQSNKSIPVLVADNKKNILFYNNIDSLIIQDSQKAHRLIADMKKNYTPIEINLPYGKQYLYYKNSTLLTQLQYYPYILILIISIFIIFTLWYFSTLKRIEQSFLWAGLAKETAHQIGTPLSSIMGWVELLKIDKDNPEAIKEIENDISRLSYITDRFSKIGSQPELRITNIIQSTEKIYDYLRKRISKSIEFQFTYSSPTIYAEINESLYNWVIENLVKNAVDSIKNKGTINIHIFSKDEKVYIEVSDTGTGILANKIKKIFTPGYTTKKRGWGLGLSLAKRIIRHYHNGKIFVHHSEINKGTTFRIILKEFKN